MPNTDLWDGFFYPTLTRIIDSYNMMIAGRSFHNISSYLITNQEASYDEELWGWVSVEDHNLEIDDI